MTKEKVLVVPTASVLSAGVDMEYVTFCNLLATEGSYIDRDQAETDESFLQIIPYVIIFGSTKPSQSVFLYQRLKGGSEGRLASKFSIGVGGHIDCVEENADTSIRAVYEAAKREIKEEIGISVYNPTIFTDEYLIYDPTNEVGRVHLGVLMRAFIEKDNITSVEKDKILGSMVPLKIVYNKDINLENWSKAALELCFTRQI